MRGTSRAASDLGLAALVLAAGTADIAVREVYNRVSAEAVGLLVVGSAAIGCGLAASLLAASGRGHRLETPVRLLLVLATFVALVGSIGRLPTTGWAAGGSDRLVAVGGVLTALALLVVAWRAGPLRWRALRRALIGGSVLFIASPWAIGTLAPTVRDWPGLAPSAAPERAATLVLLLDELNASVAAPLVAELERAGLATRIASVQSVGDKTGDVVPSLFAGAVFRDARACTFTATCDGRRVIDFARIQVTRPDVDVVGFFQPYCAMQGLRSCVRTTVPLAFLDPGRVRCGLWRRTGWDFGVDQARCSEVYVRPWGNMTDATVAATLAAPTLRQGGLLFAHLPLPHPPGQDGTGTLQDHYRANVLRAAELLRRMLETTQSAGLTVRVLIFSDHPLRQAQWCRSFAPYTLAGCRPVPGLEDTQVPVIVAGRAPPELGELNSNLGVFELVARLR